MLKELKQLLPDFEFKLLVREGNVYDLVRFSPRIQKNIHIPTFVNKGLRLEEYAAGIIETWERDYA